VLQETKRSTGCFTTRTDHCGQILPTETELDAHLITYSASFFHSHVKEYTGKTGIHIKVENLPQQAIGPPEPRTHKHQEVIGHPGILVNQLHEILSAQRQSSGVFHRDH
jgi:hypothetical protein